MAPLHFSANDFFKILQKITVLETKIHRIEGNMEANGQFENERKSPCTPPWNALGARPKDKDLNMERCLTGRTPHQLNNRTGWPESPSRQSGSANAPRMKQQWTTITAKSKNKPIKETEIRLENRFDVLPVPEVCECPEGSLLPSIEARPKSREKLRKPSTAPDVLLVGDGAVNGIQRFFSKRNTKVICSNNDFVSDISEKIEKIAEQYPQVKTLVIHAGAYDVCEKHQSEVLKKDFLELLNKVQDLNMDVFISGPLPIVYGSDERFTRLMTLNKWLKKTCASLPVNFIENFDIFWERRHLFKKDGVRLNKTGLKLLSLSIFHHVRGHGERKSHKQESLIAKQLFLNEMATDDGLQINEEEMEVSSCAQLQTAAPATEWEVPQPPPEEMTSLTKQEQQPGGKAVLQRPPTEESTSQQNQQDDSLFDPFSLDLDSEFSLDSSSIDGFPDKELVGVGNQITPCQFFPISLSKPPSTPPDHILSAPPPAKAVPRNKKGGGKRGSVTSVATILKALFR